MLNQLKFTIIFCLEYLDQILSTAVDVEYEKDDAITSTDGTACTTIFGSDSLHEKYTVSQFYGESNGISFDM